MEVEDINQSLFPSLNNNNTNYNHEHPNLKKKKEDILRSESESTEYYGLDLDLLLFPNNNNNNNGAILLSYDASNYALTIFKEVSPTLSSSFEAASPAAHSPRVNFKSVVGRSIVEASSQSRSSPQETTSILIIAFHGIGFVELKSFLLPTLTPISFHLPPSLSSSALSSLSSSSSSKNRLETYSPHEFRMSNFSKKQIGIFESCSNCIYILSVDLVPSNLKASSEQDPPTITVQSEILRKIDLKSKVVSLEISEKWIWIQISNNKEDSVMVIANGTTRWIYSGESPLSSASAQMSAPLSLEWEDENSGNGPLLSFTYNFPHMPKHSVTFPSVPKMKKWMNYSEGDGSRLSSASPSLSRLRKDSILFFLDSVGSLHILSISANSTPYSFTLKLPFAVRTFSIQNSSTSFSPAPDYSGHHASYHHSGSSSVLVVVDKNFVYFFPLREIMQMMSAAMSDGDNSNQLHHSPHNNNNNNNHNNHTTNALSLSGKSHKIMSSASLESVNTNQHHQENNNNVTITDKEIEIKTRNGKGLVTASQIIATSSLSLLHSSSLPESMIVLLASADSFLICHFPP